MKPDQEKVKVLLVDTIALLCKNGLHFKNELKIQGLLGITVDGDDVFIVHIDETFSESVMSVRRNMSVARDAQTELVPQPVAEFNHPISLPKGNTSSQQSASKPGRKRVKMEVQTMKQEKKNWREEEEETNTWTVMRQRSSTTEIEEQTINDGSYESHCHPSDMVWMGSGALNEPADGINFESQTANSFDSDIDIAAFAQSTNSLYDSNVGAVACSLNSSGKILKAEDGMEMKSEDAHADRSKRRSVRRRRSNRNGAGVPLMAGASFFSPINSDQQQVSGEVIGYPMPAAVCWENDDENAQQEQYQEWLNCESGRSPNKRLAQNDDREKSFVCQYDACDKAFYRKDHLIRHQRIKHGKPFGVDSQTVFFCHFANCGKIFYKNASLHRHMNDAHGCVLPE